MKNIKYLIAALFFLLSTAGQSQQAWNYVGVPYTDWAYDPFTYGPPPTPVEWPSAAKAGYYRVEPDNPASTDATQPGEPVDSRGKRYGYPDKPRLTVGLTNKNLEIYPPGVVFWLKGGTYDTWFSTSDTMNISCLSDPSKPFRIYGDPTDKPVLLNARLNFVNASYGFVDNIVWDSSSKGASCIGFGSPFMEGKTHHIALRNIDVQNRKYVSNSAVVGIASRGPEITDGDIHDIVSYRLNIKACGYGVDWNVVDADFHGYKINGKWSWTYPTGGFPDGGVPVQGPGNRVYRIWVIENKVIPGDDPDPLDGFRKGMAGSFIQVGDQKLTEGNTDHVYMAGCELEGVRQSTCGFKRSADCVISSNITLNNIRCGTAQGQAYNFKYDRQDNLWVVNNKVVNCDAFVIRAETTSGYGEKLDTFRKQDTRVYIIGNVFKDCMRLPFAGPDAGGIGGRKSKGICIQDFNGKVYVMNNVVDTSTYGIFYGTSGTRQSLGSEMHAYNNAFLNLSSGADTSEASNNGICVITAPVTKWFMENNFTENGRNYFDHVQYTTAAGFNARLDAEGNMSGNPLFVNSATTDYRLQAGSPLRDAGIQTTTVKTPGVDLYQLFNDAFAGDPDFPGSPSDVWPRSWGQGERVVGSQIDIGVNEYGASIPPPPVLEAPTNGVAPTITGPISEEGTITLNNGAWIGVPNPYISAILKRYDGAGVFQNNVVGVVGSEYTFTTSDVGFRFALLVTGSNSQGSVPLSTALTAPVAPTLVAKPSFSSEAGEHITPNAP